MEKQVIMNKKMVRKNKSLRKNQKIDKKLYNDRKLNKQSVLKRNIAKVIHLSSEELVGQGYEKMNEDTIDKIKLLERIKESKLTGMSGNGFLVAKKIESFLASPNNSMRTIIVNAAECEPGLLHDAWLIRHKSKFVIEGLQLIREILQPKRIIVVTRGKISFEPKTSEIEYCNVPLKYPMGEEHFLIKQVLGIEIDRSENPSDHGILMMNIQTVYQIDRIAHNAYMDGHFVTLADLRSGNARIAYVVNGENIYDKLELCFGKITDDCYAGGGIMQASLIHNSDVFTEGTSFAAIVGNVMISNTNSCKKCGGCSKRCPMGILVKEIVLARESNPNADISKWKPEQCIQCGTCTYFCMAGKDISAYLDRI